MISDEVADRYSGRNPWLSYQNLLQKPTGGGKNNEILIVFMNTMIVIMATYIAQVFAKRLLMATERKNVNKNCGVFVCTSAISC